MFGVTQTSQLHQHTFKPTRSVHMLTYGCIVISLIVTAAFMLVEDLQYWQPAFHLSLIELEWAIPIAVVQDLAHRYGCARH